MFFSDTTFSKLDGKAGFGFAIWFNGYFVAAGSLHGRKVSSSKDTEARAILSALIETKARASLKFTFCPMLLKLCM